MKSYNVGEDMTIEQAKALYFDEDALLLQPRTVYRMDNRGRRFYFTVDGEGEPRFYLSVTSFIAASLPTSPFLIDWIAEHGRERANELRDLAAAYGTLLHTQIARFLIENSYDLDRAGLVVEQYVQGENLPAKCLKWTEPLKRDMVAFAQFIFDVDFKPLAIEAILADDAMGLGGAIDIVGLMNVEEKGFFGETYKTGEKAGQPKESKRMARHRVILDVKSGRKGFYEAHELQLRAYRRIWNNTYPEHTVEKCFNWSPKDWRTAPGYNLKDQTDTPKSYKFDHLLAIAKIEAEDRDDTATIVRGVMQLNKPLDEHVQTMPLAAIVRVAIEELEKADQPDPVEQDFDALLDMEDQP